MLIKMKLNRRVNNLAPSGIRKFFDLVLGMKEVISLGVGEPDFVTPWKIREKAIFALEEGYTSYTSNKGLLSLRRALSRFLKRKYNLVYNPEKEILITAGVSEGLDLACRVLLEECDKAIVPYPAYVAYPAVVSLAGGEILPLFCSDKDNFQIDLEQLEKLLVQRPKLIILNYPNNPTGISFTRPQLRELWSLLRRSDIYIVSDEIYDLISYDFPHTPFASLRGAKKHTIYLGGFSKNFAMTGFRLGFACGPEEIISAMTKIHSFTMLCAPIVSQIAASEALVSETEAHLMVREYRRRRDFIVKSLNELGLTTPMPQGAFYCFSSIKAARMESLEFASRLLYQKKVAVVPGEAFGAEYKNFVRISFASPLEELKTAISRIKDFLAAANKSR